MERADYRDVLAYIEGFCPENIASVKIELLVRESLSPEGKIIERRILATSCPYASEQPCYTARDEGCPARQNYQPGMLLAIPTEEASAS